MSRVADGQSRTHALHPTPRRCNITPAMQPQVRYVKSSDGTRLAVATLGQGQPLVMVPVTYTISIEGLWELAETRRNLERLAENRKLVLYDCRGVGLSSR